LIKRKPGFSGKMFWSLQIPFKTGFTALCTYVASKCSRNSLVYCTVIATVNKDIHIDNLRHLRDAVRR